MNNKDIVVSVEHAQQASGINAEELAAELAYFADSIHKLAQRIKADKQGDLNITDIDRFSIDLCCGDMSDELFDLQRQTKRLLAPYQTQLLIDWHDAGQPE